MAAGREEPVISPANDNMGADTSNASTKNDFSKDLIFMWMNLSERIEFVLGFQAGGKDIVNFFTVQKYDPEGRMYSFSPGIAAVSQLKKIRIIYSLIYSEPIEPKWEYLSYLVKNLENEERHIGEQDEFGKQPV
jgi:hypothetical protein